MSYRVEKRTSARKMPRGRSRVRHSRRCRPWPARRNRPRQRRRPEAPWDVTVVVGLLSGRPDRTHTDRYSDNWFNAGAVGRCPRPTSHAASESRARAVPRAARDADTSSATCESPAPSPVPIGAERFTRMHEVGALAHLAVFRERVGRTRSCRSAPRSTSIACARARRPQSFYIGDPARQLPGGRRAASDSSDREDHAGTAAVVGAGAKLYVAPRVFIRADGRFAIGASGRHRPAAGRSRRRFLMQTGRARHAEGRSTLLRFEDSYATTDSDDRTMTIRAGIAAQQMRRRRPRQRRSKHMAAGIPLGTRINVQTTAGRRMTATLMSVTEDAIVVKRDSRVPEPAAVRFASTSCATVKRHEKAGLASAKRSASARAAAHAHARPRDCRSRTSESHDVWMSAFEALRREVADAEALNSPKTLKT